MSESAIDPSIRTILWTGEEVLVTDLLSSGVLQSLTQPQEQEFCVCAYDLPVSLSLLCFFPLDVD